MVVPLHAAVDVPPVPLTSVLHTIPRITRLPLHREGDLVVLATDGLLDNMYEADILRCINEASEDDVGTTNRASHERSVDLAEALARRAFVLSRDKERLSPWEEEAVAAGVVPTRGSVNGSPVAGRGLGSSWDGGKWGLALERAVMTGLNSFRGGAAEVPQEAGLGEMPEEDVTDFRGGKMDDITVVVATVRRAGSQEGPQGEVIDRKDGIQGNNSSDARVSVDAEGP